jgi:Ala-tRNA(Pro) deacylase
MTVDEAVTDSRSLMLDLLDRNNAKYRLIDHEPEGQTDLISKIRGNDLSQAAKCIVARVKIGKKETRYILAVVPGDRRLDLNQIKAIYGGSYVSFVETGKAEVLTGAAAGTIPPFSFRSELELIVDPDLLSHSELYFNACRLEQSMVLATEDYVALAKPRVERIAEV